jgi:predicted secreted protein with PEFG-CTERM motif
MKSSMPLVVSLAAVLVAVLTVQMQSAFAAEVEVSITPGSSTKTTDSYAPNPVEINVGDTVTWTNDDSQPHTATSGTPSGGADGTFGGEAGSFGIILTTGQSMSFTFTEAGEFPYFCTLHPNMVGTVVVSANGNGNGGEPSESTATVEHEDQSYTITAVSAETSLTGAEIVPGESVRLQFDGPGEVEVTLPIEMIGSIDGISANGSTVDFEPVGEGADSMTISFTVPESGEVEISGAVIPEFGLIASLVLAVSLVAAIGVARFKGSSFGLGRF